MSADEQSQAAASPGEWLLAGLFGALLLGVLLPWPRPAVALRDVCEPTDAGRFAVQCDLAAAAQRSGEAWLLKSIRVYEDSLLLRQADRAGDVRRENPGSYQTSGQLLTLVALDRSDPRTNSHAYAVRPAGSDPLGLRLSEGSRRGVAAALVAAAFAALCLARARRRARLMNQAWPAGRAALVLAYPASSI